MPGLWRNRSARRTTHTVGVSVSDCRFQVRTARCRPCTRGRTHKADERQTNFWRRYSGGRGRPSAHTDDRPKWRRPEIMRNVETRVAVTLLWTQKSSSHASHSSATPIGPSELSIDDAIERVVLNLIAVGNQLLNRRLTLHGSGDRKLRRLIVATIEILLVEFFMIRATRI